MKQTSKKTPSTKQGAASIYMVVVCALLFSVIAAGFVVLMVNESSKSGENDLSQSAYQSSLAGAEDMKLAIQKYYACAEKSDDGCSNIKAAMTALMNVNNKEGVCNENIKNLAKILHGIDNYSDENGMLIQENINDKDESVVQAYTCVSVDLNPIDYLATLNQTSPQRLIPLNTAGRNKDVKYVKISWYSTSNLGQSTTQFSNINSNNQPIFQSADNNGIGIPPVLAVHLYQTTDDFTINSLNSSTGENVSPTGFENLNNRGVFWLIPSDKNDPPISNDYKNKYYEDYANNSGQKNSLNSQAFTDSNNHSNSVVHEGFPIRCAQNKETATDGYLCSAYIEIPEIKTGSKRSNKYGTFLLSLSLPYQQPDTDIKVEMYNNTSGDPIAYDQVQVIIDSTGRANDIYSRTESRVEFYDSSFPFPDYAMTLGNDGGTSLQKTFSVSGAQSKCWSYNSGGAQNTVEDCTL